MKMCSHCNANKPEADFEDREDGWGLYDWCNECRKKEGRHILTPNQREYIQKTQFFFLRDESCRTPVIQTPLLARL